MNKITADFSGLLKQASYTTDTYLANAIESIKKEFGEGYAEDHPELIIAYMDTCSRDFTTSSSLLVIQTSLEELTEAISD